MKTFIINILLTYLVVPYLEFQNSVEQCSNKPAPLLQIRTS